MGKLTRRESRETAFKLIFEKSFKHDEDAVDVYIEYLDNNEIEGNDYIRTVFLGVFDNLEEIDGLISAASIRRKNERISKATMAILRLAVYEMKYFDAVPVNIAINEAVELAKKYEDDDVPGYVNGVLGSISKTLTEAL
ncbi:MAG: transcription antitermination factor NusB [Ruminococcaceae bacterium]|nr:transcription antitermination factor NusB [Oscillospiraceae bacterium]